MNRHGKSDDPRAGLVKGKIRIVATGLLHMLYTSGELSEILGVDRRSLLDRWLKAGLPHTIDTHGRYWFNGRDVAAWIADCPRVRGHRAPTPGSEKRAYCMHCNETIEIQSPVTAAEKSGKIIRGLCPRCGGPVHSFRGGAKRTW